MGMIDALLVDSGRGLRMYVGERGSDPTSAGLCMACFAQLDESAYQTWYDARKPVTADLNRDAPAMLLCSSKCETTMRAQKMFTPKSGAIRKAAYPVIIPRAMTRD